MSEEKEKQIEEMAKIIGIPCYKRIEKYGDGSQECPSPLPCNECTAELLYNAGYRKQSDVIDEFAKRLKEAPIKCKLPWLGLSTKEEIEECIDGIAKEMKEGK